MKKVKRPVSEKFYAKLQGRVVKILRCLGYTGNESTRAMEHIDCYLETGTLPKFRQLQEHVRVVIYSCVPEIDEAIARSAACRRRAEERRRARRLQAERAKSEENPDDEALTVTGNSEKYLDGDKSGEPRVMIQENYAESNSVVMSRQPEIPRPRRKTGNSA